MRILNKLFNKKQTKLGIVCLEFNSEGLTIALSKTNADGTMTLVHCEFIASHNKKELLKQLSNDLNLEDYDCHLVLSAEDYQVTTIEKPVVEDTEMHEAITWKINDFTNIAEQDLVLDYYELPLSVRANSPILLDVIICDKSDIAPLINLCQSCDLNLKVIEIQETALRNLSIYLPENNNGIAVLYLQKNTGLIIIERQGQIYLRRQLHIGYEQLQLTENHNMSETGFNAEQNNLALEIQRSLDYVESNFSLSGIGGVAVIPLIDNSQSFINFLSSEHRITARIMDLSALISADTHLEDKTQAFCAPVIGGTLRYEIDSHDPAN